MGLYLIGALIFLFIEVVFALPFFRYVRRKLGPEGNPADDNAALQAILMGWIERAVLLLGLLAGLPHIITAFGALKIATRLDQQRASKISNDYFLVGNLCSIAFAILAFILTKSLSRG
ncbi:MAG: hypothetical protein AAGJ79_05980 [Verrucomicrobiota bacterium]